MTIISLPTEMNAHIVEFLASKNSADSSLIDCGIRVLSFGLVSKRFYAICESKLAELSAQHKVERRDALMAKYHVYQEEYRAILQDTMRNSGRNSGRYPGGNPLLLDALLSGFSSEYGSRLPGGERIASFQGANFVRSSCAAFDSEAEKDVKEILELEPDSVSCSMGSLSLRELLTPLYVASANQEVSTEIVELLLEKKADPNGKIEIFLKGEVSVLEDLRENLSEERFSKIEALFVKYGFRMTGEKRKFAFLA